MARAAVLRLWNIVRPFLAFDIASSIAILVFVALFAPAIPRATTNARTLAVSVDDDIPLTMALDAMTVPPYGNPANYYFMRDHIPTLPEYFRGFVYWRIGIYGGVQFDLAFPAYALLKWLGAPVFPTAPMLLRLVSFLGGLLSLLLLYNFGKRYAGTFPAVFAVAGLLTEYYFAWYTMIIHPDNVQVALALAALVVAIAHSESGDWPSLLALGILLGLVQGTKLGAPWLVPMTVITTVWGWRRVEPRPAGLWAGARQVASRLIGVGIAAIIAFFITTPYAFLDTYYIRVWLAHTRLTVFLGQLQHVNVWTWVRALVSHEGLALSLAGLTSLLVLCWRFVHGERNGALVLAAVLSISCFLWYGFFGRLWVVLGYLLVTISLSFVLMGEALARILGPLANVSAVGRCLARTAQVAVVIVLVSVRWPSVVMPLLTLMNWEASTSVELGAWSGAHLPEGSRILQVHAYFDPDLFPDQRLIGLVTYAVLREYRPDYFVLSSWVYDAPWYQGLRRTQQRSRADLDGTSVRLYQDLLDRRADPRHLGPTGVGGVELVHVAVPNGQPSAFCGEKLQRHAWVGTLLGSTSLSNVRAACVEIRRWFGFERIIGGPTLMVYKLDPALLDRELDGERR